MLQQDIQVETIGLSLQKDGLVNVAIPHIQLKQLVKQLVNTGLLAGIMN
jgi:hypothetical protein